MLWFPGLIQVAADGLKYLVSFLGDTGLHSVVCLTAGSKDSKCDILDALAKENRGNHLIF